MANLTLAVDADLIRRARVRAIQEGTSLSAKVREFLQQYVDGGTASTAAEREAAALHLLRLMDAASAASAAAGADAAAWPRPAPGQR